MVEELTRGFDAKLFCDFLNSKFEGSLSKVTRDIPVDDDLPWQSAKQLGVVKSLPGPNDSHMPLLVVAAELPEGEELRERSSRIKQFKFAKKLLDEAMSNPSPHVEGIVSQGLFAFYDEQGNFRLSLVYGKPDGTKLVWSEVKRQSFYVEAGDGNKTFRDRSELPWSPFDKLKEAFSVEKLTKEFYNRLFKWYQWALSDEMGVTYPNDIDTHADDREIGEHIIRLITRLMFVWFLKQKHLVPNELFDPNALKDILKKFNPASGDDYYRAILQNLFFATLNSEIPERAFAVDAGNIKQNKEHFDIKTLYRYGKEFAISNDDVLELFKGIPFLNGGLFECLDRGKNYYDGFSRNRNKRAKVPNILFFDEKDGLIPLLNQYNFTVEENSPGDEEVALDPELLGKVFENLLGAYNPETEVAARKATGSFYTPREIVNYMVDESLIAYLKSKVGQTFPSAKSKKNENMQTGMSAPPSLSIKQTGMHGTPSLSMPDSPLAITRRRLPHWQADGAIYWVTFRLADSIPQDKLQLWRRQKEDWLAAHPEPWTQEIKEDYDETFTNRMENWLDAGMGSRALARTDIRNAVKECLLKFDGERLRVHSAVIMPTHVHCLIEPLNKEEQAFSSDKRDASSLQTRMSASPSLSGILKGIKGASARAANKLLGSSDAFWMDESYDHIVRSKKQYMHFLRYIENNPVKAGLSADEYWLYKVEQAFLPAEYEDIVQTRMSASPSGIVQTRMSASPSGIVQTGMSASPSLEDVIRKLFSDGERPDDELCQKLDDALVTAKILDPACGSGAFPMGVLLRMVEVLRILREIPEDESVYDLKLQLIENCIYGSDIQCIAVQISKLRFFISLVCEQKPNDDASKNYGINSLPNLETKFVAANTLIGLPKEGKDVLELCTGDIAELKDQLFQVRHQHFSAKTYQEKKKLRREDKKLRDSIKRTVRHDASPDRKRLEMLEKELEKVAEPKWEKLAGPTAHQQDMFADVTQSKAEPIDLKYDANEKPRKALEAEIAREHKKEHVASTEIDSIADMLASWDPYDQNTSSPFLDIEWMFNVRDGFDVVIGNPPYGARFSECEQAELAQRYKTFTHRGESYVLFVELAVTLLRIGGQMALIVPDTYLNLTFTKPLRSYLIEHAEIREIVLLPAAAFETATVDTTVLMLANQAHPIQGRFRSRIFDKAEAFVSLAPGMGQDMELNQASLDEDAFNITASIAHTAVLTRLERHGVVVSDVADVFYGIKVYQVGKGKPPQTRDIVTEKPFTSTKCRGDEWLPFYDGKDVSRYGLLWEQNNWLHYGPWLAEPRIPAKFEGEKLLIRKIVGDTLLGTYVPHTSYCNTLLAAVKLRSETEFNYKPLLGILNSRLMGWYIRCKLQISADDTFPQILIGNVRNLPLPAPEPCLFRDMEILVEHILTERANDCNADISSIENELDQHIYKLYGLTPEEIAIVEESTMKQGGAGIPACEKSAKRKQAGMPASLSKKRASRKRKTKLPPSLPGWD